MSTPTANPSSNPGGAGRKILVVDDDSTIREAVQLILSMRGYEVTGAKSIAEARRCLGPQPGSCPFDLILLDIQLGESSGLELLKALREELGFKDVPVLMMSGLADMERITEAKKHGIKGFVVKPFGASALQERVAQCLSP